MLAPNAMIKQFNGPADEPYGITEYRWSAWHTMANVHQRPRRSNHAFCEIDPLKETRFL